MEELKEIMEEYVDRTVSLYGKAAKESPSSYRNGVIDGMRNYIPSAFMSGVKGLRKVVLKTIDNEPRPNSTIIGISPKDKIAVMLHVYDNGVMVDKNNFEWHIGKFKYYIDFEALTGKDNVEW